VTDSPVRRRIQAAPTAFRASPRLGDDVLMEAVPPLRRAVVSEYRRVVRPPWEIPTALVTNGALMVAAWFLLPPRAHAFLFSLNGPLAFPVVLCARRPSARRSSSGGRLARHRVPLPSALPALAMAALPEPGVPTCGG
jgi:hypothetical protein